MIREAGAEDLDELLEMRLLLWPHYTKEVLLSGIRRILRSERETVFVAGQAGGLVGFLEVSIRHEAPGCETKRIGYLEGWYVDETHRRQGIGGALILAAEDWAKRQGCGEMASDTTSHYPESPAAHRAVGYREVKHVIHFRKEL